MSARSIRRSHEREAVRRSRGVAKRAALATGAVAATAAIAAPGADAATFNVTNLNNAGANSLRGAITNANGAAGADTITFSGAATSGEIVLLTQIPITGDLTITGPGRQLAVSGDSDNDNVRDFATGDAAQGDTRIFNITDPTTPGMPTQSVSISGLTLKEGVGDNYDSGMVGSERESGGAISAVESSLTLTNVAMTDNVATDSGGAVYLQADGPTTTAGTLTVSNSSFSNNRALSAGGAIASYAVKYGPVSSDATTTITNSQVSGNRAGGNNFGGFGTTSDPLGGGVITKYGPALISDSTITGNTAQTGTPPSAGGGGGGLYVGGGRVVGSVVSGNTAAEGGGGAELHATKLVSSTVSGNTVLQGIGGGLTVTSKYLLPPKAVESSTISGNSAAGTGAYDGRGGGIATYSYTGGAAPIRNSTIAGNTATNRGGGVMTFRFDGQEDPAVNLQSSIVADNVAAGAPSDLAGALAGGPMQPVDPTSFAAGFSLVETPGASVLNGAPAGSNLTGLDPQLSPLAANGGPTSTHALGLTSPAIDSGQANGLTTDQRGSARPVDSVATNAPLSDGTDIGAFEVQDAAATGGDPDTAFAKTPPKKVKLKGKKPAKVKLELTGTSNSGAPGPLTFECKVDKVEYVACRSPLTLKLTKGKHTVEVRAVDSAGRIDSTPAKAKIKVAKKKPKK